MTLSLPCRAAYSSYNLTNVVATRIQSLLDRRGLGAESEEEDSLSRDDSGLAAIYASSIRGRIAVGSNMGYRVARLGDQIDGDSIDEAMSSAFKIRLTFKR